MYLKHAFQQVHYLVLLKIRAMEIISELEPNNRGPYGGSVGYFGFSGNMDMSITIRSFYIDNNVLIFKLGQEL